MAREPAGRIVLIALLVTTAGLAGCLGGDDGDAADAASPGPGASDGGAGTDAGAPGQGDAQSPITSDAVALDPGWEVGQFFAWELSGPNQPTLAWTTVVVGETSAGWQVAVDDPETAARDVMHGWYLLGELSGTSLSDEGDEGGLSLYDFPITDGSTWESDYALDGEPVTLEHAATFAPAIETAKRPHPGWLVEARTTNGTLVFSYDYVPAIGWFSQMTRHDVHAEDPASAVEWHYDVNDWGTDWTGAYYTGRGEQVYDHFHEVDATPGQQDATPAPHGTFVIDDGATHVFAFFLAYASTGAAQTTLIDPNDERHEAQAVSAGTDGEVAALPAFLPAVPGEWTVATVGAGVDTEGVVIVWQAFIEEGTL